MALEVYHRSTGSDGTRTGGLCVKLLMACKERPEQFASPLQHILSILGKYFSQYLNMQTNVNAKY